jgi:hypothetical protein
MTACREVYGMNQRGMKTETGKTLVQTDVDTLASFLPLGATIHLLPIQEEPKKVVGAAQRGLVRRSSRRNSDSDDASDPRDRLGFEMSRHYALALRLTKEAGPSSDS